MGMIYCIIRFVSLIGLNKLKLCVLASSDLDREVGALMRRGEKGGWLCVSCGFTSTIRARLWEHVESAHTQSTGYSCPTCEKFCSSFNAYKIHKSRYHKQNLNQQTLPQPHAAFSEALIRAKMLKMSEGGLWACSDCSHTSSQAAGMRNHVESHHVGGTGYHCGVCNRFCRTKNALDTHRSRYKHF